MRLVSLRLKPVKTLNAERRTPNSKRRSSRSRAPALWVVVLCSGLAGCVGSPEAPDMPWGLTDLQVRRNRRILDPATGLAYSGYRITRPRYQAHLACDRLWGYYSLEVVLGGESLAYTRNFAIVCDPDVVFTPQQNYRENRKDFRIREDGSTIHWRLAPAAEERADYHGSLRFEPNRLELIAAWTPRDRLTGQVVPAFLVLSRPLVHACRYRAVLADGSVAQGRLPSELPPAGTRLLAGTSRAGLRDITFHTRKGAVTIRFLPGLGAARTESGLPQLVTGPGRNGPASERVWQLPIQFPAGPAGRSATYRVVFEFADWEGPVGRSPE